MKKDRLEDLKAALEQKSSPPMKSEADYKRDLVADINRIGGRGRRLEDRYAIGLLDLIIKLPDLPIVMAEGKLVHGNLFYPTPAQWHEGRKWQAAGVECVLLGWKAGQMFCSPWVEHADIRECFTLPPDQPHYNVLYEYLR